MKELFSEAAWSQPSIILLDDLDYAIPSYDDAQEESNGEGPLSIRRAGGGLLLEITCRLILHNGRVTS